MTGYTVAAAAFLIAVVLGFSLALGAPIYALPIVLMVLAIMGIVSMRRQRRTPRERPRFTERDRETLLPAADEEERQQRRREAADQARRHGR